MSTANPATTLRITSKDKGELGILEFEETKTGYKLVKGVRRLIRKVGNKRLADVIILTVMGQFTKREIDCGNFNYGGDNIRYISLGMERILAA